MIDYCDKIRCYYLLFASCSHHAWALAARSPYIDLWLRLDYFQPIGCFSQWSKQLVRILEFMNLLMNNSIK